MKFQLKGKVTKTTPAGTIVLYDEVLEGVGTDTAQVSAEWYAQMDAAFGKPEQGETIKAMCNIEQLP